MKKWIAFILSFYILMSTVVPCTVLDNCEQEKTAHTAGTNHKNECGDDCSPFSICSAAHAFIDNSNHPVVSPVIVCSSSSFGEYYFSSNSTYYPTLFQPPRISYFN